MDPTVTYRNVIDYDASVSERAQAAVDLLVWLARHGSAPNGVGRSHATHAAHKALFDLVDAYDELTA